MIRIEIDTKAHYELAPTTKNTPGALLTISGWVIRRKVKKPEIHNVVVRESGVDLMFENMKQTPKEWSWDQCFLHNVNEALSSEMRYSDRGDWIALRCSDKRLEKLLHAYYDIGGKA